MKAVIAGGLALLMSQAVFAAEQWTGFYAGASAGFGFNTSDNGVLQFRRVDGTDNSEAIDNAFGDNFGGEFESDTMFGLEAGYDWRTNNFVYGVGAEYIVTDLAQEQRAFSATPATYINRREVDSILMVTGRLGLASERPLLPYLMLGYAKGDVEYSWQGNSGAFQGTKGDSGDGTGLAFGLGVEFNMSKASSLIFEYRDIDLGDASFATNFSGEENGGPLGNQPTGASMAFGTSEQGGSDAMGTDQDFDFETMALRYRYRF